MKTLYSHHTAAKDWRWPNFTPAEIACKQKSKKGMCGCGGEVLVNNAAMDAIQSFRRDVGVPVILNSAYRCKKHNENEGGAENSMHRKGRAFDVRITPQLSREAIHGAARRAGFKGIGDYQTFVHIDNRTTPSYWDYR